MKHYLDIDGKIYGYELDGSQDYLIGDKTPITREEVDALIAERYPTTTTPAPAPAPTKEELMAKLEALAAQIAALDSGTGAATQPAVTVDDTP
jgi:hypothetical protein